MCVFLEEGDGLEELLFLLLEVGLNVGVVGRIELISTVVSD